MSNSSTPEIQKQVITVCAFIYKQDASIVKLFCPRRDPGLKFLPGVYELPGGHVGFGETLSEALKRKILNELNMRIEIGECFYAYTYENTERNTHSVEVIYFAQFVSDEKELKLDLGNHSEYKWMSLEEYRKEVKQEENPLEYKAVLKGFEILEKNSA